MRKKESSSKMVKDKDIQEGGATTIQATDRFGNKKASNNHNLMFEGAKSALTSFEHKAGRGDYESSDSKKLSLRGRKSDGAAPSKIDFKFKKDTSLDVPKTKGRGLDADFGDEDLEDKKNNSDSPPAAKPPNEFKSPRILFGKRDTGEKSPRSLSKKVTVEAESKGTFFSRKKEAETKGARVDLKSSDAMMSSITVKSAVQLAGLTTSAKREELIVTGADKLPVNAYVQCEILEGRAVAAKRPYFVISVEGKKCLLKSRKLNNGC